MTVPTVERGLRDAELARGLAEARGVGGGNEGFELTDGQIHRVTLSIGRLRLFDRMNARP